MSWPLPTNSSTALRVVRSPEGFQPLRNGCVLTQIVAWRIALDVQNRAAGPGIDAADPEGATGAAQQSWCADPERVRTARGASRKQSHLRQPCAPLGHLSARLPRPLGPVEPDYDEEVAVLLDAGECVLPTRQDFERGLGPRIIERLGGRFRCIWSPHVSDRLHTEPARRPFSSGHSDLPMHFPFAASLGMVATRRTNSSSVS